jgi:hypothetical protein
VPWEASGIGVTSDTPPARPFVTRSGSLPAEIRCGTAVPQGRLMLESEQLIADFQRRVRDAVS